MTHASTATAGRRVTTSCVFAASLGALLAGGAASAQSLTVLPVNIELGPGQLATTLTVLNQGTAETSVQIRALLWSQSDGVETLTPSDEVLASPPIATIPAAGSQVVRLVLRHPPKGHEATYRVLLDQIPPPAAPGTVRIALRLSIPIFAEPETRALPHVRYRVETDAGKAYLIASNDGGSHDTIRDIVLTANDGGALKLGGASPYILAGATSRWRIESAGRAPAPGETLHLTAKANTGVLDQPVPVVAHP
jgi:fimbrial chaperone protein